MKKASTAPPIQDSDKAVVMQLVEAYNLLASKDIKQSLLAKAEACQIFTQEPFATFWAFHRCKSPSKVEAVAAIYHEHQFSHGFFQLALYFLRRKEFDTALKYAQLAEADQVPAAHILTATATAMHQNNGANFSLNLMKALMEVQQTPLPSLIFCILAENTRNIDYLKSMHAKPEYADDKDFWKFFGNYEAKCLGLASGVEKLQASCEMYPDDYFDLGILYLTGTTVKEDKAQAIDCFNKGLAAGNFKCHYGLGNAYFLENPELAKQHFQEAIRHKIVEAQAGLARLTTDPKTAERLYLIGVEQGDLAAQFFIANFYAFGKNNQGKISKGLKYLQKAATSVQALTKEFPMTVECLNYYYSPYYLILYRYAKFMLANFSHTGLRTHIKVDRVMALKLCREAVALGEPKALELLVTLHDEMATRTLLVEYPKQDDAEIIDLITAINTKIPATLYSCLALADLVVELQCFKSKDHPFRNVDVLIEQLMPAVNENNPLGLIEHRVAKLYQLKDDHVKAIEFFTLAFKRGHPLAKNQLKQYATHEVHQHLISRELKDTLFPVQTIQSAPEKAKAPKKRIAPPKPLAAAPVEPKEPVMSTAEIERNNAARTKLEAAKAVREKAEADAQYQAKIKREQEEVARRWEPKPAEAPKPKLKKAVPKAVAPAKKAAEIPDDNLNQEPPPPKPAAVKTVNRDHGNTALPSNLIDWSTSPELKKKAKAKRDKRQTWLDLACQDHLSRISSLLKFEKEYTTMQGDSYLPVLPRALLYHILRYHLLLAEANNDKFSDRFVNLLLHAHFRVAPDLLIDFAKRYYIWDGQHLPNIDEIAHSKFCAILDENMPNNLYQIKRSVVDRRQDLATEFTCLNTYGKAIADPSFLNYPEFLVAARMSVMIIAETWQRTKHLFDASCLDPDWLICMHGVGEGVKIRNTEKHENDTEAYQDSLDANFPFEVYVTSDFPIKKIWIELTQLMYKKPYLIKEMFACMPARTPEERHERLNDLLSCLHLHTIVNELKDLIQVSIDYFSTTQPSYTKYLMGKLKLLELKNQGAEHDLKFLTEIRELLTQMGTEEIQVTAKLMKKCMTIQLEAPQKVKL